MRKNTKNITRGGLIAAMYVVLSYAQYMLFPESTSYAIQFRASEALCILALFTPSAIWGLGVGCFLYNVSFAGSLPLDMFIGTLATLLSTAGMYLTRKWKILGYPVLGMLLPAICNGLLIGWELNYCFGTGFWLNCLYVAIGEGAVLLSLGTVLYYSLSRKDLSHRLFDSP